MKTKWNSGMDYSFSMIKSMMCVLGVWPLQENDVVYTIRWLVIFAIMCLTMIITVIEPFKSCGVTRDNLELLRAVESVSHTWLNIFFARIYMKKIAINVTSAIDDWCSVPMEKKDFVIMMRYARVGRIVSLIQVIIIFVGMTLWIAYIFLGDIQEIVTIGNDTIITWKFLFPTICFYKDISYTTYKIIFILQLLQSAILITAICAYDNFYFIITMHLCGQLELLKIRFNKIDKKRNDKKHDNIILAPLIKRHYELIMLAKNIEDVFNLNILLRLLFVSTVIAAAGIGIIISLKHHDHMETLKMMISVKYYMLQVFLYTYAGDILQRNSEAITSAIYDTSWHKLPSTTVKDLIFIMMRTKIPLRISAGKFFYLRRTTMTDIIKTTVKYISFLQRTINY